ncbi:MerR family transcriptional regulator [Streptosporangium lutulentum]|uniref:DNA-binding transcriptional MerR regulator n=1 Tax=Streptosporangium lutulentum TaxID=1461250 RepID=A0ABT9QD21_9ACTN|nr:MerR family transcriptional regulator [Streptosporangium lutulentum]MDP9844218.1 DNA-binding transcriptional MerR regulator [Streptosporangium lutulentum]
MKTAITGLTPEVEVPEEGLPISAAAAACGLSVDALRYYEREGLTLTPADRAPSGRRRYFEQDLSWLAGLVMLRRTGMPIRDIRAFAQVCREKDTEPERLAVLEAHRDRILAQLRETQGHLAAIERKINFYRESIVKK